MNKKLSLTKQQQEVIDVKNRDVLVAASAGSGKTFVVVERIINRVISDKIDIDKILVVTFTNAAAAELKERIVNRFYDCLKSKEIDEETKRHIQKQLSLVNRAQISTIHSFCLNIIKSNFFMLDIDSNVKTLDESKAKILLLESINEVIEEEYDKESEMFTKILEIFRDEANVINCLEKLYSFSRGMVDAKQWLEASLEKYNLKNDIQDLSETDFGKEIIASILDKAELLENEILILCDKMRLDSDFESRLKIFEDIEEKISDIKNCKTYNELYNCVKNTLPFPRLPSSKCVNEELKNEVSNVKKNISTEIENMNKILYMDTEGIINELNSMYNIVKWFVDTTINIDTIYTNKKTFMGQIDFNDYEHLALKVLENEEIAKQYKNKYEDIYIDEYQDTSYIQEAIVNKISRKNRIMVGDVKQSIYSFRNAEPKLFNEKYNTYTKYSDVEENSNLPSKIVLAQNFRSRKNVLENINDIFKAVMSDKIGECNYTEDEYLVYGNGYDEVNSQDYSTEINIIETESKEEVDDNVSQEIEELTTLEKEAYEVAGKIEKIIQSGYEIYDLKKKEYRKASYKDIVILMRSVTGKANIYEEILKKRNIPVFCDVSESFYNGEEVALILSLLKVLDNNYDDISLVAIMYSIIGNFTLDELVKIRQYDKNTYFYNSILKAYQDEGLKNSTLYDKLDSFIGLLKQFQVYLNTYTIAETILKIYEETGIYYSFYLEERGKQKCANLDRLVELAKNFEREQKASLYEFICYIENMKESKAKGSDTPKLLGEGEDVVRILTIHKSKGLEYPIVFLVNSSKKYNMMDVSDELLFDKEFGIGIDIYNTALGISYASIIKQAIKEKIKNRTLSEEERLLYVAMTRAKEKLYIYGVTKNYDKLISKIPLKDGKVSTVMVKSCNNYLSLILLALSGNNTDNFKINVNKRKENTENTSVSNSNIIDRRLSIKEKFLELCEKEQLEKIKVDYKFEKKYKYIDSLDIKKKYSVSEIKTKQADNEYELLVSVTNSIEEKKPKCINQTNISNTKYGTIIHKILENIDYYNLNIDKIYQYIDDEIKEDNINKDDIKGKIIKYLNSDIMKYVKQSKSIQKEQPFVIYDKLENIDKADFSEKTYIQGIIDLIITLKDDSKIIIDFKTDRVDNENELIDRYKVQLEVYKKGVELSHETQVKDIFIYSFYLDKVVKVEI